MALELYPANKGTWRQLRSIWALLASMVDKERRILH